MAADPAQQRRQQTAAEVLAQLGATDPAAAAFDETEAEARAAAAGTTSAVAMSAAQAAEAAGEIVRSVLAFGAKRGRDDYLWIVRTLRSRYPEKPPSEVEALARKELAFDAEFRRKQRDRLERDLPEALRLDDPARRAARVQAVLERERRYLEQRREAMAERAIAAAELDSVRAASAEGAFWLLSPFARQHTPLCIALGNKFWPWEALDAVPTPPIHAGCRCSLMTKDEAVGRGLMHPDQVPDTGDAVARATHLAATIEEALGEGLARDELLEWALGEQERLARLDALHERWLAEAAGTYYGALPWQRFSTGFQEGGQFKGRRAGIRSAGRKAEHLLGRLASAIDLRTPAQSRRDGIGRPATLNGVSVNVPEHRAFERTIGGVRFSSPPGSTRVYAHGRPLADGHPLLAGGPRGKASPGLFDRPMLPGDLKQGDEFVDSTGEKYRVAKVSERFGRTRLTLDRFSEQRDRWEPSGTHGYRAGEDQGFRAVDVEAEAERARGDLHLPAASRAAAALGKPSPNHPPVAEGADGAATDSALRTLGFHEASSARQIGSTRVSYVHAASGHALDVSYRDDNGRAFGADWRPGGAKRQPAGQLERPPKSWGDFAGYLAAFVEHQGARHGVETHLRSIVADDSTNADGQQNTPDHAGTHEWSGDVVLGADVRPAIEAAIARREAGRQLTEQEARDLWTAYRVAHHEALHGVNPVDQSVYETPAGGAIEEWLAEEASARAAHEALRRHGFGQAADWAAAHPLDQRVQGSYLRIRASADRLLDEAKVAPEERARLVQELKLAVDPGEREQRLADLLREGNPSMSQPEALARVHEAFEKPPRLPQGWAQPLGLSGDEPAPLEGGRPEPGQRALVARRVRDSGGFRTDPQEGEVLAVTPQAGGRWIATVRYGDGKVTAATDREVLRVDAGSPSAPVRLDLAPPVVSHDELGTRHVRQEHVELAPGDPVAWDGRADGGVSQGEVVRVHRGGARWLVEARTGDASMAPGERVLLTPERTGGHVGAPEQVAEQLAAREPERGRLASALDRLRPSDGQAADAARFLGIELGKASPGQGEDYAALLGRSLLDYYRDRPPNPEYDAGFTEGVQRAIEIARSGGSFDDVADSFRAYRSANVPREADLGDHPHAEGVVTGMIWAAIEGRDAEQQAVDYSKGSPGFRRQPLAGLPNGATFAAKSGELYRKVPREPAPNGSIWVEHLGSGKRERMRPDAVVSPSPASPGFATRGKPSPGFFDKADKLLHGGGHPSWQAKVYGGQKQLDVEPPLDPKKVNSGDIVRDPAGRTWKVRLAGTNAEPTLELTGLNKSTKTIPEAEADGKDGWRFVRTAYGAAHPGAGTLGSSPGGKKPAPPKAPEHDDGGQLTRDKAGPGGADWYTDPAGARWLVQRWHGDQDKVAGDLLANGVLRELGADVPAAQQFTFGGKPAYGAPAQEFPEQPRGTDFAAHALVANWGAADRSKLGGSLFWRPGGGKKDFGAVPAEMWTLDGPKGPLLGAGPTDAEKADQARAIAERLTPDRIDALVDAAPFKSEDARAAAREALQARVAWMGRFAKGEEKLPEPLAGADARAEVEGGQEGFDLRPEEHAALEGFAADPKAANAALHDSLRFDGKDDASQLASLGGAPVSEVAELPKWDGPVEVGKPSGPTEEEALAEWEKRRGKSQPKFSAGVIVKEPDGRVWMMKPKGGFGGYGMILPKGRVDEGEDPQEAALRELWEETGLTARITGLVGDYVGDVTITRYFTAERTGGLPAPRDESELVVLGNQLEGGLKERDIQAMRDAKAGDVPAEVAQQVEALDGLLRDAPKLGEDVQAWATLPGELPTSTEGTSLSSRGYLSASFERPAGKKGTLLRLLLPEGTRAYAPQGIDGAPDLLLPRSVLLRVVRVTVEDGRRVADVVAVPAH